MIRVIVFLIFCVIISCEIDEINDIPSYISIENIELLENSTHNITDVWVYIDDNIQGVYELPTTFPLLQTGKHKIRVKAGIKDNGIAGTRIPYPFYKSFIISEQDFNPKEIISILPEFTYLDSAKFFIEDFEGTGINIETSSISDTVMLQFSNSNGSNNYYGAILNDSLITFEITTSELSDLPHGGAPVYLELDYKCNTQFLVGVYVNFPQTVLQKDLLWINPKQDWNKIYINLTSTISESLGAESFKVFITMKRDFSIDINTIYFDNIKVVY